MVDRQFWKRKHVMIQISLKSDSWLVIRGFSFPQSAKCNLNKSMRGNMVACSFTSHLTRTKEKSNLIVLVLANFVKHQESRPLVIIKRWASISHSLVTLYECSETIIERERMNRIKPEPGFSGSGCDFAVRADRKRAPSGVEIGLVQRGPKALGSSMTLRSVFLSLLIFCSKGPKALRFIMQKGLILPEEITMATIFTQWDHLRGVLREILDHCSFPFFCECQMIEYFS